MNPAHTTPAQDHPRVRRRVVEVQRILHRHALFSAQMLRPTPCWTS